MKKILVVLGLIILSIIATSCSKIKENNNDVPLDENIEYLTCIEEKLDSYISESNDKLIDLPLNHVINNNKSENISYYKAKYSSKNKDNQYMIVYPKNGLYDFDIMNYFDKHFYNKYSIYQTYNSAVTPSIYIHTKDNNVDFEEIVNQCRTLDISKGKSLPSKTISKIKKATRLVIKSNKKELGSINNEDRLNEILNAIITVKTGGDAYLCDGHLFEFLIYDKNNKLIDTLNVWGDGKRILPESVHNGGCLYYTISNGVDIRKIIEEETDYVFYSILNFSSEETTEQKFIYKDNNYKYYLKARNQNEVLVYFHINNQVMNIKYALENNYISADEILNDYPDILIKVKI